MEEHTQKKVGMEYIKLELDYYCYFLSFLLGKMVIALAHFFPLNNVGSIEFWH